MFIICRGGHLVYYWDGETPIFLEKEVGIFPSRRSCLQYLQNKCGHSKERAIHIITLMQKKPLVWFSV